MEQNRGFPLCTMLGQAVLAAIFLEKLTFVQRAASVTLGSNQPFAASNSDLAINCQASPIHRLPSNAEWRGKRSIEPDHASHRRIDILLRFRRAESPA